MKLTTFAIALIHLAYIVGFMWLGPFFTLRNSCGNKYYLLFWALFLIAQILHWEGFKGECILSYWEKKCEDSTWVNILVPCVKTMVDRGIVFFFSIEFC